VDLVVTRNGKVIAEVSRPVPPSPDRTPKSEVNLRDLPAPVHAWDFRSDEGLTFTKGKYSKDLAKLADGVLLFDDKGHQQVNLPEVALPAEDDFTVLFRVKTDKKGPCQIIRGDGWSFALGNWNAIGLTFPGGSASARQTEEDIRNWFIDHWASVAIVKRGSQWGVYLNGRLMLIGEGTEKLPEGPMALQLGDAAGNVAYGMLGQIDDVGLYGKALSFEQIRKLEGDHSP
jgi:hypothetical protein